MSTTWGITYKNDKDRLSLLILLYKPTKSTTNQNGSHNLIELNFIDCKMLSGSKSLKSNGFEDEQI